MSKIEQIAGTVMRLTKPGLKAREPITLVRKEHPKASKGEITRGAFYAKIVSAEDKLDDRAAELHGAAIDLRSSGEEESWLATPFGRLTPRPCRPLCLQSPACYEFLRTRNGEQVGMAGRSMSRSDGLKSQWQPAASGDKLSEVAVVLDSALVEKLKARFGEDWKAGASFLLNKTLSNDIQE